LKVERGKSWVHVLPIGEVTVKSNLPLHIGLFLTTVLTTLLAGAMISGVNPFSNPARLVSGVPFAFTLLAILGTHEFGHYFTARHHGTAVTLPYFIPAPPPFLAGTLGALIRMKSPVKDRNALFDIAIAGPLAGLVVAIPALIFGLGLSKLVVLKGQAQGMLIGDSLLVKILSYLVFGSPPDGIDILIHPVGLAGWFGLFVTALNLLPAGQLDGGHIAYALFGRRHRQVSVVTVFALVILGFFSINWIIWAALLLFLMGLQHTPPLNDISPISAGRRALGYFALLLLILLIPPVPIQIQ
jgi:membrane-associated protease RseP (regulator of RpoE activity)